MTTTKTQSEKLDDPAATMATQPAKTLPPDAKADGSVLERVERMLDETETALVRLENREQQRADDAARIAQLKLSVVIPVYNERETIREIVAQVRKQELHHEIIIVDDYSTDGTRDVLLELEQEDDIRVFLHGYNRGKGAALRTGFHRVKGDVVIIQDADLEYDPRDYERLLEPIRNGEADVVYGSRYLKNAQQDGSWWHRLGNRLLTNASNLTTGQGLTDMETCYKVFRRGVLHRLTLRQDRFGFEPEVTAKVSRMGLVIKEVPIRYNSRGYDEGKKIGWRDGVKALWCIARYAWRD